MTSRWMNLGPGDAPQVAGPDFHRTRPNEFQGNAARIGWQAHQRAKRMAVRSWKRYDPPWVGTVSPIDDESAASCGAIFPKDRNREQDPALLTRAVQLEQPSRLGHPPLPRAAAFQTSHGCEP